MDLVIGYVTEIDRCSEATNYATGFKTCAPAKKIWSNTVPPAHCVYLYDNTTVIICRATPRVDLKGSKSPKNEAKTLKTLSFSIKKDNIFIKKLNIFIKKDNISIEKLNIFIKKLIISIEKDNISIEQLIFSIKKTNISIEKAIVFTERDNGMRGTRYGIFRGGADHVALPNNLDFLTGFDV